MLVIMSENPNKPRRKFRSLTFTLAVSSLSLVLISVLVVSNLLIYFNFESQQFLISDQQQNLANVMAEKVGGFVREKSGVLMTAASILNMNGSDEDIEIGIDKALGSEPSFRQIILMDKEGKELTRVSRFSVLMLDMVYDHLDMGKMISSMKRKENYMSSVFIDETTSEPIMIMAVPVKNVFGDFEGILLGELNLKFMWDLVDKMEVGKTGVAYVVDKEGKLLAFGDTGRVLKGEAMTHLKEVSEFIDGDELNHSINVETSIGIMGEPVVANHAHITNPDWAVVIEVPVDEVYEYIILEIQLSVLMIVISVVISIILGTYISRRITRPIINLRNAAIRIGKGDLGTRICVESRNEIGELSVAFQNMVQTLKNSQSKLKSYASELEHKVQDRTKNLDQKVEELTKMKTAILNMMEDTEDTNIQLMKAKKELEGSFQKLKEVDMRKDEFISVAAHELKTPLTAIHGFSQLLRKEKIKSDKKTMNKYLDIIDRETKRLSNLVTEILELSRIDIGTIKLSYECINLNELVEGISKEMMIPSKSKGLSLKVEIKGKLGFMDSDRERLTQVLINLINNSVKYTPKGGITFIVSREKDDMHFIIEDTGIGIAKENREKIFERFYQVDSSYTRKAGGTGLGLSLCKEYVEIMGGKIWVESELGKGSRFHVTLPLKKKENILGREARAQSKINDSKPDTTEKEPSVGKETPSKGDKSASSGKNPEEKPEPPGEEKPNPEAKDEKTKSQQT
jgi:signal transduction histidine kinase